MSTTDFSQDHQTGPTSPDDGSDSKKEQAKQAAGTAKDEGQRVVGVAQDEAKKVSDEAKNQVRGLLDEATSQVDTQSKEQKSRLAETVRTFGDDLGSMTEQGSDSGLAAQLVRQVSDQATSLAEHLESREPRELLDDVRSFARRRPGTFLVGALAAGVVVGRLTRGAQAARSESSSDTPKLDTTKPLGTTTQPSTTPAGPALTSDAAPSTSLGAKGVEMSESGVVGGGRG